ncbi:hypothetical protein SEA_PHAYONCE_67 [Mycobacterium phage Phayonce]|uniref:Uncharacterized protein n=1 Tax=Mycobacterium phage Phayonce TaxID=1647302 RepID=A0A0F6SJL5_9CAUD|nr:hypothetical protein SEA_PHAYONCE_67 [Mycobacterium phage Phayonce]AKF14427.1 hypothetical protein SEA_PHAYONCE_67 [Mycobacterium phage Phayonce]
MISTADALDVMAIVAACHPRTAPRMDDDEAAIATATIWAELFNAQGLELDDLAEGVKARATTESDAPEPADICAAARAVRRNRNEREDRAAREARQEHLDAVKAAEPVAALPAGFVGGQVTNRTPRFEAAEQALQDCYGRDQCRAALVEYFAAKREALGMGKANNRNRRQENHR